MNTSHKSQSCRGGSKKKPQPIHSYGIILYRYSGDCQNKGTGGIGTGRELQFLLYKRRDNFEYMDFLRGLWSSKGQLSSLFSLMNTDERERIRNYTFPELWNDLWVEHTSRIYRDGYDKAKKKYESINDFIPKFLSTTNSVVSSTPWGFPKGKKNSTKEKSVSCAKREFTEETGIPQSLIDIIHYMPFTERFTGSNGKVYATNYYLAKVNADCIFKRVQTPQCIRESTISEEASEVEWFTYEEACSKLSVRRQEILRDVKGAIKFYENSSKRY